jgi:hypothetical protein
MTDLDLVIIGGGQSGLAAAHAARRAGLSFLVLEAGDHAAGSWASYYDSLTLFSPARYSELPGRRFGGDRERYPTRDEIVDYLRAYAADFDGRVLTGQRVSRVEPGFTVFTDAGLELRAARVIAATGGFGQPYRPPLPGLDGFAGVTLHAAEYRQPVAFAGQRVVVVGGGNSAIQIAAELMAESQSVIGQAYELDVVGVGKGDAEVDIFATDGSRLWIGEATIDGRFDPGRIEWVRDLAIDLEAYGVLLATSRTWPPATLARANEAFASRSWPRLRMLDAIQTVPRGIAS